MLQRPLQSKRYADLDGHKLFVASITITPVKPS
jgi:hypothetical protein